MFTYTHMRVKRARNAKLINCFSCASTKDLPPLDLDGMRKVKQPVGDSELSCWYVMSS